MLAPTRCIKIRVSLRGKGVVLMGKNTMVPPCSPHHPRREPPIRAPPAFVKGNIGFVFTSDDLKDIREIIVANKVAAPARAGAFAPKDVTVPACNTGMGTRKDLFLPGSRYSHQDRPWYH